jgi:hypothetical protein
MAFKPCYMPKDIFLKLLVKYRIWAPAALLGLFLIKLLPGCSKDSATDNSPTTNIRGTVTGSIQFYDQFGFDLPAPAGSTVYLYPEKSENSDSALYSIATNSNIFELDSVTNGRYIVIYQASGYDNFALDSVNIKFGTDARFSLPEIAMCKKPAGVLLSARFADVYSNGEPIIDSVTGILNFHREILFDNAAPSRYFLKTRYFFGFDKASLLSSGEAFYTWVSGAIEGNPGQTDSRKVPMGFATLEKFTQPNQAIHIAASIEPRKASYYAIGGKRFFPGSIFPLVYVGQYTFPNSEPDIEQ